MTATLLAFHPRTSPPAPTFASFLARLDVPRIASYGSGLFRGDAVACLYRIARGETSRPVEERGEALRYLDALEVTIDDGAALLIAESQHGPRAYVIKIRTGYVVGVITMTGEGTMRLGSGDSLTGALLDASRFAA